MDRRVSEPGPLIGTGRAADVYDVGNGKVLRRYRTDHDSTVEAAAMRAAWAAGYPVPEVFDADGRDLVMERLEGPTMLDVLGKRPWRYARIADQLADLHTRLAALQFDACDLRVRFEPAECLVHLDLHPANVMLTSPGAGRHRLVERRDGPTRRRCRDHMDPAHDRRARRHPVRAAPVRRGAPPALAPSVPARCRATPAGGDPHRR